MALSEFELIARYFTAPAQRADVHLGVGDDAALLAPRSDQVVVAAVDTYVEAAQSDARQDPEAVGWYVLARPLARLAATAAEPTWATLALTLPAAEANWLERFSAGLRRLAARYGIELVGGDVTRGPLTATVVAHGLGRAGEIVGQDGTRAGDTIWVSGVLGGAVRARHLRAEAAGRDLDEEECAWVEAHLDHPRPPVDEGLALRGLASAACEVSRGLHRNLGQLLAANALGATIAAETLPLAPPPRGGHDPQRERERVLAASGDLALCFTLPPARTGELLARFAAIGASCTRVGMVETQPGIRWRTARGNSPGTA